MIAALSGPSYSCPACDRAALERVDELLDAFRCRACGEIVREAG